MIRWKMLEK